MNIKDMEEYYEQKFLSNESKIAFEAIFLLLNNKIYEWNEIRHLLENESEFQNNISNF